MNHKEAVEMQKSIEEQFATLGSELADKWFEERRTRRPKVISRDELAAMLAAALHTGFELGEKTMQDALS